MFYYVKVAKGHQDEALGTAQYRIIHKQSKRVVLKKSEVERVLEYYRYISFDRNLYNFTKVECLFCS